MPLRSFGWVGFDSQSIGSERICVRLGSQGVSNEIFDGADRYHPSIHPSIFLAHPISNPACWTPARNNETLCIGFIVGGGGSRAKCFFKDDFS